MSFCAFISQIIVFFPQTLPKTAYFKLIDWWLIFYMWILVATMVFHTYVSDAVTKARAAASVGQTGLKPHLVNATTSKQWMNKVIVRILKYVSALG